METRKDLFAKYRADIRVMNDADILKYRVKKTSSFYEEKVSKDILTNEEATYRAIQEANFKISSTPYKYYIKNKKRYYMVLSFCFIFVLLGLLAWLITIIYRG
ncbi:MAG: hypothetical protein SPL02_01380 [Bacilli bacterium]|nr:hypothetical protein [Bacilli bacterium]MDY6430522.1 hypothetical protein [Bacilli bacterium]